MNTEYEIRILNTDINQVVNKCFEMGAELIGCYHQKRYVYDFKPPIKGKWIRLRDNGQKTTLAVKMIKDLRIDGTQELEIAVSDFDSANDLLYELGYTPRSYQENYRIEFVFKNVVLDIDRWPLLQPYLEIEGKNKEDVLNAVKALGFSNSEITTVDVDTLYKDAGITLNDIDQLRFSAAEIDTLMKVDNKKGFGHE